MTMGDIQASQAYLEQYGEPDALDINWSPEEARLFKKIFRGLKEQRDGGRYCDLTVKVSDKCFRAHKNVLAALSPHFAARISEDPAKFELEMEWISANTFEIILDYAYGTNINNVISDNNVEDILRASSRLLIAPLTKICSEYLGKTADLTNMVKLYDLATEVSCSDLAEFVNAYVRKNFQDVSAHASFLELKPELVVDIIRSNDFNISEEVIFESVMRWLKHKDERACLLLKMMVYVRLALLSPTFLRKQAKEEGLIRNSQPCLSWFSEILLFKLGLGIADPPESFWKPRSETAYTEAFLVWGDTDQGEKALVSYSVEHETMSTLTTTPLLRRETRIASASDGEFAYFFGKGYAEVLSHYNASSDDWTSVQSGLHGLSASGIACLNGYLYSTVARSHGTPPELKRYDPDNKVWMGVAKMPVGLWDCHIVAYLNMVYVFGGSSLNTQTGDVSYSRCVQKYNPQTNTWSRLPDGPFPLSDTSATQKLLCCAFEGKLFVMDGSENNQSGQLTRPYVYNLAQNTWAVGAALHQAYMNPSALLVLNGKLTFIDSTRLPYVQIETFSPSTNTWVVYKNNVKLDNLKKNFHFVREAVLVPVLPKCNNT